MKEITAAKEKASHQLADAEKDFTGYTIEEIRFQRALVVLEKEFCKNKIQRSWQNIQDSNPLMPGNKASLPGKAGAIALKMVNGLNYVDYILLGFSVMKGVRKVFSLFRGRKK